MLNNELFLTIAYIESIFLLGWVPLQTILSPQLRKTNIFLQLSLSWLLGNGILALLMTFLAYFGFLNVFTYTSWFSVYLLLGLATLIIVYKKYMSSILTVASLQNIIVIALFLGYFFIVIRHSVESFVLNRDAVAIWFLKAKSLYLHSSLQSNILLQNNELYEYSHKTYPFGIPAIISGLYRILGNLNDQIAKLYIVQFFIMSVFFVYGLLKHYSKELNTLSHLLITFIIFTSPVYFLYSHNGYMDVPLGFSYGISTFALLLLLEKLYSKAKKIDISLVLSVLVISIFSLFIKREGIGFAGLVWATTLGTVVWYAFRYKAKLVLSNRIRVLGLSLLLLSIFVAYYLWNHFISQTGLISYTDASSVSLIKSSSIEFIFRSYLQIFLNTSLFGVTMIISLLIFIIQLTKLIQQRIFKSLPLLCILVGYIGLITFAYATSSFPLQDIVKASLDRIILQSALVYIVILIFQQHSIESKT